MQGQPVILVNLMKVAPADQAALIALLSRNIETVVRHLAGWRSSRLIASKNGAHVVIHSEWDSPAAVEAMRADARMRAYFPKIQELATFESCMGETVFVCPD